MITSSRSLGLKWSMSLWTLIWVVISMLLSSIAVSAHYLAERERTALTRVITQLTQLRNASSTHLESDRSNDDHSTFLSHTRRALEGTFLITESSYYHSPLHPIGTQLSSRPNPVNFTPQVTANQRRTYTWYDTWYRLIAPLEYEIGVPSSLPSSLTPFNSPAHIERAQLIIRIRSIGLTGQLFHLWSEEGISSLLQILIITLFALYLVQRSLVTPLLALTELARDLCNVQETPKAQFEEVYPEFLTLQDALLELHQALREEQTALTSAYTKLQTQERLITAGSLSARVMHELGNPLASVSGLMEFMRDDSEVKPEHRELLELALSELWRMRDISRTLLQFTRPERETSRNGEITTGELIDWTRFILKYHEHFSKVFLEVSGSREWVIKTNEASLKHALLNLIMNAARAQHGEGEIWLAIEEIKLSDFQKEGFKFTLSDQGPGVDGSLNVVELSEKSGGLGLLIASESMAQQGGQLWIERARAQESDERSSEFPGARFVLWIPHNQ